jgi:hypothetical protein
MDIVRIDDNLSKIVKGSYEFKDLIKKHGGKWDNNSKIWIIPNQSIENFKNEAYITKEYTDRAKRMNWQKALDKFDLKFVSKGTKDYEKVFDFYKSITV